TRRLYLLHHAFNRPVFETGRSDPIDDRSGRGRVTAGKTGGKQYSQVGWRLVRLPVQLCKVERAGSIMLNFQCEPRGVAQMKDVALPPRGLETGAEIVPIGGKARVAGRLRRQRKTQIK